MKLKILQENLSDALHIASRFTSSRAQLPVLGNILFLAKNNKLSISATNLEMSILLNLGSQVEKEGEITIPARTISDLITNLTPGTLVLEAEKEQLSILGEGTKAVLSGMNTSDFPSIPQNVGRAFATLPKSDILDALSKVLYAVSVDETRPVLTGVLIIFRNKEIIFVSTDGFRLSQKRVKVEEAWGKEETVILPKNELIELTRLVKDEKIKLEFKKEDKQVLFGFDNLLLISRIIDGEFPDFERIIPKSSSYKINVDRDDLLRAVKLSSVFARDAGNVVRLKVTQEGIELNAESQLGGSGENKIEAKIEGEGKSEHMVIAFNYRFLEDFLNSLDSEDVLISLTDPNSPGVFTDPKDPNFLHLIMPVRIQS